MGSTRAKRRKRRLQALHVPFWYYILLGLIAAAGIAAIAISNIGVQAREMDARDLVSPSDHALGSWNAPVTIIEWSSFTCGYCSQHVLGTMPLLQQDYIDTGSVRYIHRPSFSSEYAPLRVAAESLYCAGDQGRFWEMHRWQHENSEQLVGAAESVTVTVDLLLQQAAPALGLNTADLAACLQSEKYRAVVEGFVQDAANRGLTSTPTFLVNTELKVGATYEELQDLIAKELVK